MVHVAVAEEDMPHSVLRGQVPQQTQPTCVDRHDVIDEVGGHEEATAGVSM
jgi:hypothetical protein